MPVKEVDAAELTRVAAAYRAAEQIYGTMGSPLYAQLCRAGAEDPEVLALTSEGLEGAAPVHLFTAVHYLLLADPADPLSRFFATLSDDPAPPEQAWPDFARYCAAHIDEIRELLATRPVQMTYVERCRTLLPALCAVADEAIDAPLNLIEIGCSAGVLLAFDHYAYELRLGERVGPSNASIELKGELHGGPVLRIPSVGTRTGIDLNLMDPHSPEDRRWLLATCYPEFRREQARLAEAMDIVAATQISWHEGNALDHLARALAEAPDPVCVYHSACLFYWNAEDKAALDTQLREASRSRPIHRLGIEPTERFSQWQTGRGEKADSTPGASGEITITTYRDGDAKTRVVGRLSPDFGTVWWLE